jgi:hypothetical protein
MLTPIIDKDIGSFDALFDVAFASFASTRRWGACALEDSRLEQLAHERLRVIGTAYLVSVCRTIGVRS